MTEALLVNTSRAFSVLGVWIYRSATESNMNTLERRRIARAQIIDAAVAKAAIHQSRRQREEAARGLRKALGASAAARKAKSELISHPHSAAG